MGKRVLVTLSPELLKSIERLHKTGLNNARYGCAPSSTSETIRRLVIDGLERYEANKPHQQEPTK